MSKIKYRLDIDGLRAVAVMAVVVHHLSAQFLPGGYVGVDVFFVISGYLITGIISREMQEGSFTFARFYERRVRRIFPALFSVLAVTLVAGYLLLLPSDFAASLRATAGTLLFSSNIVFWREMMAGYFAATDSMLNPLLHTWSLAVEEQFYVGFPFLLLICFRYFPRYLVPALLATAITSLAASAWFLETKSVAVFFLSPFRAWELMAGSLLAVGAVPPINSRPLREILSFLGLVGIGFACVVYDGKTRFPGLTALVPVLASVALIHVGGCGGSLVTRFLAWRPMVFIGLISYSLYLWHWPLIVFWRYSTGMEPLEPYIPALFVFSLILAALSYRFIERPFRRPGGFSRRAVFLRGALVSMVLLAGAGLGIMRDGFSTRFSPEVNQLDAARAPIVPHVNCSDRFKEPWCTLGENKPPEILLWGDSHSLAWAPALERSLSKAKLSAAFVTSGACPPLFGINNISNKGCADLTENVKRYLRENSRVNKVILSAYWGTYFKNGSPVTFDSGGVKHRDIEAAQMALAATLEWLHDNGNQVVLLGPVPSYDKSVPLALALEVATNRKLLVSSAGYQHKKHEPFFDVVTNFKTKPWFSFMDPIEWMCSDECIAIDGAVRLYRDAHHLSVAGALMFEEKLAESIRVNNLSASSIVKR